jgi:hypothetical protein
MTTFGGVPVQAEQNKSTSTFVAWPDTAGVNVWPNHDVLLKPVPLVLVLVFCWSMAGVFVKVTLPGVVFRSALVATPAWKSVCAVSVRQPLCAAAESEKFFVVVPLLVTTMVVVVAVVLPG